MISNMAILWLWPLSDLTDHGLINFLLQCGWLYLSTALVYSDIEMIIVLFILYLFMCGKAYNTKLHPGGIKSILCKKSIASIIIPGCVSHPPSLWHVITDIAI